MRKIDIGTKNYSQVIALDESGPGNANHEYAICRTQEDLVSRFAGEFGIVHFQNGPVKEKGINGCHNEDLLAIVIDRLECFQSGPYACEENVRALGKIEEGMGWLRYRTVNRIRRGVEGTNKI